MYQDQVLKHRVQSPRFSGTVVPGSQITRTNKVPWVWMGENEGLPEGFLGEQTVITNTVPEKPATPKPKKKRKKKPGKKPKG